MYRKELKTGKQLYKAIHSSAEDKLVVMLQALADCYEELGNGYGKKQARIYRKKADNPAELTIRKVNNALDHFYDYCDINRIWINW
jgi:hypothetical protein